MSKAAIKCAADLKLVSGHVTKDEAGFDVLGPSVANAGGSLADSHLFDKEAAFGSDGFDVFFEASGEAESRVESLGVKDALEHCLEVLCRLRRCTNYGIPAAGCHPSAASAQITVQMMPSSLLAGTQLY